MHKPFTLNQDEISWAWQGFRSRARKKLPRASAAVDTSSWSLTLEHLPTGIEVRGEIPMGHYSNKQMKAEKEKLWEELQEQLRLVVANHLRLPGR